MFDQFIATFGWLAILGSGLTVLGHFRKYAEARRHRTRAAIGLLVVILLALAMLGLGIANIINHGTLLRLFRLVFPASLLILAISLWTSPDMDWDIDRTVLIIITALAVAGLIGLATLAFLGI
ncbi:MAG TPA: hypothetical protein VFB12_19020 [Ktedonobacteraceae bacterium]|nr:hypothetical protein [Ktedonobacteraceae bacterium]